MLYSSFDKHHVGPFGSRHCLSGSFTRLPSSKMHQTRGWSPALPGCRFLIFSASLALETEGQDLFFQGLEKHVDLLAGSLPAEGDTEGSVDDLWGEVHGGQHVAPVALGAGGTGGNADAVLLQQVQGVLGGNAGDGQGQDVGSLVGTVDADALQSGDLLDGVVQQFLLPLDVGLQRRRAHAAGGGEAEDGGGSLGAGAEIVLLTAAHEIGGEGFQPGADVQRARALGAVDLVAGNGDQVRAQTLGLEGHLQEALDRIGVENGIGAELAHQLRHLGDGHDRAGLVVDHHDGHQEGVLAQGGLQVCQGDAALTVGLEVGDLKALPFQLLHGVEDGVVLHGGGDDVLVFLAEPLGRGKQSPVVSLGAAGGEEHPVRLRAHGRCHLHPRGAQLLRRLDAEAIQRTGIAPVLRQGGSHRLHSLGTGLRGGGIIQINHITYLHKNVQKFSR